MKIALYIEEGLEQLVLTPSTDAEKSILAKLEDGTRELKIYRGDFYPCKGGWMRHRNFSEFDSHPDKSTIIVLRPIE